MLLSHIKLFHPIDLKHGAGVAVLDEDMRVLVWSRHAEDLWGLRVAVSSLGNPDGGSSGAILLMEQDSGQSDGIGAASLQQELSLQQDGKP